MNPPVNVFNDRVFRVLIVILVVFFVVMGGPFIVSSVLEKVYDYTRESELRYTLNFTSTSPLSNVTLFIPLPAEGNGTSPVIELIGTGNQSYVFSEWNISIYGANNESYLKLWTDRLSSSNMQGIFHTVTLVASSPALNVRDPLRYDYTLNPKLNLTVIPCGNDLVRGQPLCYQYQSLVYASYHTAADAIVNLQVRLSGINQWEIQRKYQNEYTDSLSAVLYGPVQGWYIAEGLMVTSCGDDNPFWKEQQEIPVNTNLTAGVNTSMLRWHTFTPLP